MEDAGGAVVVAEEKVEDGVGVDDVDLGGTEGGAHGGGGEADALDDNVGPGEAGRPGPSERAAELARRG